MRILRFTFVILAVTANLIFVVWLRSSQSKIVHELFVESSRKSSLNNRLCEKQLELEALISPASLLDRLETKNCAKH